MKGMVLTAAMPFPLASDRRADGPPACLASLSDEALMLRYGEGDRDAFEVLYRRHRASLHRFVRRLAPAESEELFQEVWLAVIRGRERYRPSAKFSTYLFAITHNKAASRLRALRRSHEEPLDERGAEDIAADESGPLDAVQTAELGQALLSAIAALPLAQRETFLLHAEAGLGLDEIASVTGALRETVKSRLRYANKFLRKALEAWR